MYCLTYLSFQARREKEFDPVVAERPPSEPDRAAVGAALLAVAAPNRDPAVLSSISPITV